MKSRSAVLRCGRCAMLTHCFLIRYHCEFSQGFLRRLGDGYEATNKGDRHNG